MKLWTGDEWRALSDNEALHRIECGYIVLEDDDPRTLKNESPAQSAPEPEPQPVPELTAPPATRQPTRGRLR